MQGLVRSWNQQLQWFDNMLNNYRDRSYSYESFKHTRTNAALNSAIFTPVGKKTSCPSPDYPPISYASPQQFYTNHSKNCQRALLECHLSLTRSASIRHKRLPSTILRKEHEKQEQAGEQKAEEVLILGHQRQRCLHNYFTNLAAQGQQGQERGEGEKPAKSKTILLIRKINKRKEELAQRARERLEEEFRSRKQVPIHHTQFHFHKQRKSRTEQSPCNPQQQKADFTQKIHRAVEEILRLRATFSKQEQLQDASSDALAEKEFRGIIIEGGNFSTPSRKAPAPLSIKLAKKAKQKAKECGAGEREDELGPWVRTSNDFQLLL